MYDIFFCNHGLIDMKAVTTFGVSAKDNENPIGYFGTGLKYAISIILRNGGKITLHRGRKTYKFHLEEETIRGKSFSIVHMNGEPLGFTSEVGKDWELWQAFRELYCNVLDEKGMVYDRKPSILGEDTTLITVSGLEEFDQCYRQRNLIVLEGEPFYRGKYVEFHFGPTQYVYYRGIKAGKFSDPAEFTYNIVTSLSLTEDRTLKYTYQADYWIIEDILQSKDTAFLKKWFTSCGDWECKLNFDQSTLPSGEFLAVAVELLRDASIRLPPSLVRVMIKAKEILPNPEEYAPRPLQKQQLERAFKFLHHLGVDRNRYPIFVVEALAGGALGKAQRIEGGRILISKSCFELGTKMLAGTIWEEYVHLAYDKNDFTRGMQEFLLNSCMTLLEELTGEPM